MLAKTAPLPETHQIIKKLIQTFEQKEAEIRCLNITEDTQTILQLLSGQIFTLKEIASTMGKFLRGEPMQINYPAILYDKCLNLGAWIAKTISKRHLGFAIVNRDAYLGLNHFNFLISAGIFTASAFQFRKFVTPFMQAALKPLMSRISITPYAVPASIVLLPVVAYKGLPFMSRAVELYNNYQKNAATTAAIKESISYTNDYRDRLYTLHYIKHANFVITSVKPGRDDLKRVESGLDLLIMPEKKNAFMRFLYGTDKLEFYYQNKKYKSHSVNQFEYDDLLKMLLGTCELSASRAVLQLLIAKALFDTPWFPGNQSIEQLRSNLKPLIINRSMDKLVEYAQREYQRIEEGVVNTLNDNSHQLKLELFPDDKRLKYRNQDTQTLNIVRVNQLKSAIEKAYFVDKDYSKVISLTEIKEKSSGYFVSDTYHIPLFTALENELLTYRLHAWVSDSNLESGFITAFQTLAANVYSAVQRECVPRIEQRELSATSRSQLNPTTPVYVLVYEENEPTHLIRHYKESNSISTTRYDLPEYMPATGLDEHVLRPYVENLELSLHKEVPAKLLQQLAAILESSCLKLFSRLLVNLDANNWPAVLKQVSQINTFTQQYACRSRTHTWASFFSDEMRLYIVLIYQKIKQTLPALTIQALPLQISKLKEAGMLKAEDFNNVPLTSLRSVRNKLNNKCESYFKKIIIPVLNQIQDFRALLAKCDDAQLTEAVLCILQIYDTDKLNALLQDEHIDELKINQIWLSERQDQQSTDPTPKATPAISRHDTQSAESSPKAIAEPAQSGEGWWCTLI